MIRCLHGGNALQGAFTQTAEAACRWGADRRQRFKVARAEANEAAACAEAFVRLGIAEPERVHALLGDLHRLSRLLMGLTRKAR